MPAASVDTRMGELRLPTLILQGSNDPWVPCEAALALSG